MREVLLFHFVEADMDTYRIDFPKALPYLLSFDSTLSFEISLI